MHMGPLLRVHHIGHKREKYSIQLRKKMAYLLDSRNLVDYSPTSILSNARLARLRWVLSMRLGT
jgi:hypothetical protein